MKIEKIENKKNIEELQEAMDLIFKKDDKKFSIEDKFLFKSFAYAIKDDNGKIIGGISGWRIFCEIYIDELVLDEKLRGQGYGKKLIEIVETEINDGNCDNINLVTNSFLNATGFYKKCGFKLEFVRKNGKDSRFDKYYMIKKL